MNYLNNRRFRIISSFLIICLIISILPWRELYADSLTHDEYNCSPLSIVYDQNSTWDTCTQGQYTVTNESSYNVTSWSLVIIFADDVTVADIWNVRNTDSFTSSQITVTGNSAIGAGSTYTFGMIVSGTESAPVSPVSISLVNAVTDEPELTPVPTEEPTPTEEPAVTPSPSGDFTYAIFASSTSEDISIQGWKANITGDILFRKRLHISGF